MGLIKIGDLFGASDNDKSLTEQPANEHGIMGLERTSDAGGKTELAMEGMGQQS